MCERSYRVTGVWRRLRKMVEVKIWCVGEMVCGVFLDAEMFV